MPSFAIQFHASGEEIGAFVKECLEKQQIYATLMDFPPFSAREVSSSEIRAGVNGPKAHSIMLSERRPHLPADTSLKLMDKNPGSLVLQIGKLTPEGLRESCLSTLDASEKWKSIARGLKKITRAGSWAINPNTGASAFARDHRYTEGAKELSERGIKMLAIGAGNFYRLGKTAVQ